MEQTNFKYDLKRKKYTKCDLEQARSSKNETLIVSPHNTYAKKSTSRPDNSWLGQYHTKTLLDFRSYVKISNLTLGLRKWGLQSEDKLLSQNMDFLPFG